MKNAWADHMATGASHNNFQVASATANALMAGGVIICNGGAPATVTFPTPTSGLHDGMQINFCCNSGQAHVLNFGSAICRNLTGAGANPCTTITMANSIGASVDVTCLRGIWTVTGNVGTHTYA